jgi:hypothetical protein
MIRATDFKHKRTASIREKYIYNCIDNKLHYLRKSDMVPPSVVAEQTFCPHTAMHLLKMRAMACNPGGLANAWTAFDRDGACRRPPFFTARIRVG